MALGTTQPPKRRSPPGHTGQDFSRHSYVPRKAEIAKTLAAPCGTNRPTPPHSFSGASSVEEICSLLRCMGGVARIKVGQFQPAYFATVKRRSGRGLFSYPRPEELEPPLTCGTPVMPNTRGHVQPQGNDRYHPDGRVISQRRHYAACPLEAGRSSNVSA